MRKEDEVETDFSGLNPTKDSKGKGKGEKDPRFVDIALSSKIWYLRIKDFLVIKRATF